MLTPLVLVSPGLSSGWVGLGWVGLGWVSGPGARSTARSFWCDAHARRDHDSNSVSRVLAREALAKTELPLRAGQHAEGCDGICRVAAPSNQLWTHARGRRMYGNVVRQLLVGGRTEEYRCHFMKAPSYSSRTR